MNETLFQEWMKAGLGRAILYARDNDVQPFQDVILDSCLHFYSVDPQSEGTRAAYMLELVSLLPDRQFYCEQVLRSLPHSRDDWDAVQRFHFATYMSFDGDERAKRIAYESFEPGPKNGESIAVDFVRMDGLKGLVFAASKIGALLIANLDEVDEGSLWSQAVEICGEDNVLSALSEAGYNDPRVEAYRLAAISGAKRVSANLNEIAGLSYENLRLRMPGLRWFELGSWGKQASADELECAAHGLTTARRSEDRLQHLQLFGWRRFPFDPAFLLSLSSSDDADVAYAAAVALAIIQHPYVRTEAFRLANNRLSGREWAISMLDPNWAPGDHDTVLDWFERESDRVTRHRMQSRVEEFWEHHPDPANEVLMLSSLYEKGTCSFCRVYVVRRLIDLDSLSDSLRSECAYDASNEIREMARVN